MTEESIAGIIVIYYVIANVISVYLYDKKGVDVATLFMGQAWAGGLVLYLILYQTI